MDDPVFMISNLLLATYRIASNRRVFNNLTNTLRIKHINTEVFERSGFGKDMSTFMNKVFHDILRALAYGKSNIEYAQEKIEKYLIDNMRAHVQVLSAQNYVMAYIRLMRDEEIGVKIRPEVDESFFARFRD